MEKYVVTLLLFLVSMVANSLPTLNVRYTKITGTFVKFDTKQKIATGTSYAKQVLDLDRHEFIVTTHGKGKSIETKFKLKAPEYLDFVATSNDGTTPPFTGHFFNADYEDCIIAAFIPDQRLSVTGTLTKLDSLHALSIKTVSEAESGKVVAVMQEWIELISEEEFEAALSQF